MSYQYQQRQVTPRTEKMFVVGQGRISGYLSMFLGGLSLLAVLAYLYPSYLTTPELRAAYNAESLQHLLKYAMYFSLFFGVMTFALNKRKRMGATGISLTLISFALGGYMIPVGPVDPAPLSLGVDWLILAFLGSTIVFTTLEKLFPKYKEQVILREEWGLDFFYFCFNHLLISVILLVANFFVSHFNWAVSTDLQSFIQSIPLWGQVVLIIICADFVLYWEHRIFHELPKLWRIHAVHHSVECMDWLAGSRGHVVQVFIERSLVMIPLYLLAPSKEALDLYVTFAALQAIIIHSNLGIPFGPIKYLLVTPQYHHWHHSSEKPALDTNYSAHTPLFDRLFGTYHMPTQHWPAHYGTTSRLPRTFIGQLLYPFKGK
ncbi:sterol desaturase family protein [Corallincola spongiicola]|uniref:Sterol desaturase family protein n=1 Tax=Corallincola spongiicola TaxID=2520508 RepID=A0ABY1WUJ4_9GAMM|nr:sterol desaturase family protein [Corallincola spongiicola]TAA48403.1 sterol desaturase family protein [Corallincola spongiicola]